MHATVCLWHAEVYVKVGEYIYMPFSDATYTYNTEQRHIICLVVEEYLHGLLKQGGRSLSFRKLWEGITDHLSL